MPRQCQGLLQRVDDVVGGEGQPAGVGILEAFPVVIHARHRLAREAAYDDVDAPQLDEHLDADELDDILCDLHVLGILFPTPTCCAERRLAHLDDARVELREENYLDADAQREEGLDFRVDASEENK